MPLRSLLNALKQGVRGVGTRPPGGAASSPIAALIATEPDLWRKARAAAAGGPRVLVATNVTGFQHASLLEALLAIALTLRGADVRLVACDAALPACLKVEPHSVPDPADIVSGRMRERLCDGCMAVGSAHFDPLGLTQHRLSDLIGADDRRRVRDELAPLDRAALGALTSAKGDALGMQGLAGALRYYASATLPEGAQADEVLRRFVEAAALTAIAYDTLLARETPSVAVFHHGIYVPQGPAGDVLRRHGVRVVNWNPSYRRSTFIFSHGDTYHHTLMSEGTDAWDTLQWTGQEEQDILSYLQSRATGTRDWIWFHEKPDADSRRFVAELGLDPARPIIGMLSNVAWDAQLHYPANAFPNMMAWVFETIAYFARRPDLQLLLRIHPAEIRGTVPSAQPLLQEIRTQFPQLPSNVFIIPPESNISTYAAMALCDSVLIYGTKTGVELTAVGKPVIVAGEAWIRNKGLTRDAASREDYLSLLDTLPVGAPLDAATVERARKYAYHFFFRRMLPLPFVVPSEGKIYGLELDTLSALGPTRFPGLDVVCDGILSGRPFVYEAERFGLHA